MGTKTIGMIILAGMILSSCTEADRSDAYGQFDTDKLTVSAETGGKLLAFEIHDGDMLTANAMVAEIDSSGLILKKAEIKAVIHSVKTQYRRLDAQANVFKTQLKTARKEYNRLLALQKDGAATQQQVDAIFGQVESLEKQIQAVEVQKEGVDAEILTHQSRIAQMDDQLNKTRIYNPINGQVLKSYVEQYELIQPGKPLYQIADMTEMILRVYISGAQLSTVTVGQQVEVLIDQDADTYEVMTGRISWISSVAEFTPKMIQTKEERVSQVYAMEVRVENPKGKLKIGMPGEVNF